jgi:hypothetical protein
MVRAEKMREPRAVEVLRRGRLEVRERAASAWESSDGTVRAVDVRLLLDGHALGIWQRWPAVRDAVIEAITAVAPGIVGATVVDLDAVWGLREHPLATGYRGEMVTPVDPDDPAELRRAAIGFLFGRGDAALANALLADPRARLPADVITELRRRAHDGGRTPRE